MEVARASLTLPFPLAWMEWSGGVPGLPEARWGLLLQTDPGEDVRGGGSVFLLGAPSGWRLRPNFFGGLSSPNSGLRSRTERGLSSSCAVRDPIWRELG